MNVLKAKFHADALADAALVAYWADKNKKYHEDEMVRSLEKIASAMGFVIIPLHQNDEIVGFDPTHLYVDDEDATLEE